MHFHHVFRPRDDTAVDGCAGFHSGLYYPHLNKQNKPKNQLMSQFNSQKSETGIK